MNRSTPSPLLTMPQHLVGLPSVLRPSPRPRWRPLMAVMALSLAVSAAAQGAPASPARSSAMDAELFYQLLLSEAQLRRGEAGVAVQVMTEAARRQRDDRLFRRAVDMAIEARGADLALGALKTWRHTLPRSTAAVEMQAQVLAALGRSAELQEPVRALIELTPAAQRPAVIASVARLVGAGAQGKAAAQALEDALKPWRDQPATRLAVQLASARLWAAAGEPARALDAAQEALAIDAQAEPAALIALDLWPHDPRAEAVVRAYLRQPAATPAVRLGLARRLAAAQRYPEALEAVRQASDASPQQAGAWMMRGALEIELGQPRAALGSLQRYLDLKQAAVAAAPARAPDDGDEAGEAGEEAGAVQRREAMQETAQVLLMAAQACEQLKDYACAQQWLDRLGEDGGSPQVVQRRASLLARQGQLARAQALLQTLPEDSPDELRAKVMAQTQVLRESQQWAAAYEVLVRAGARLPDDPDLLYEQALLAEKLHRHDEMEAQLRRVIALRPDQQHAYNALGYSLADRGLRLAEARELVAKALQLAPHDPFITDSMGWVEFRAGNRAQALKLLREAWERRPDVEIAAHLGEVLWADGQKDAARLIWRAGRERDAANEVLVETLRRLKVDL